MLTRSPLLTLLLIEISVHIVNAFSIIPSYDTKSKLGEFQVQKDIELVVRLDVGEDDDKHMLLDGFQLKLSEEKTEKDYPVDLPGANGPRPNLSSGAKLAEVISCPSFIDMSGMQKVNFENGCWEIIWRDDARAGSVVCGFDVPNGAIRNGAKFPSGNIYVTFVLWAKEELAEMQAQKAATKATADTYKKEKEEALEKYKSEDNILLKALHYRKAARAVEKYDRSGMGAMEKVPDNTDVFPISNRFVLTTKGTVWMKEEHGLYNGQKQNKLLGSAIILPDFKEKDVNKDDNIQSVRPQRSQLVLLP